ncbi:MAG: formylglycine-generating enzyme family protein, partial [Candidatus Sumerlaeota bacterium]|nr:formylglycine-generating enzyme family protein [Candidatus Sumerlaeota bacterium]
VFCNWLSEKEGFSAAYNTTSWKLIDADSGKSGTQFTNGYRLPTEAEWERAAGWNGTTHWIYGFQSDTLTGKDRCNYRDDTLAYINPLGLVEFPYTSPVGWFNGLNTSPNGLVQTINSPSPVGAYDMTGNVYEWCHDWYGAYSSASKTNPIGPGSSPSGSRVNRGGSWLGFSACCRSAYRNCHDPRITFDCYGFRVVRSTSAP